MNCVNCQAVLQNGTPSCPDCGELVEMSTRQSAQRPQPARHRTSESSISMPSTKAPTILVGRRGHYLVQRVLAQGGMGKVFIVEEMDTHPPRQLIAKRSIDQDEQSRARFQREIEIATRIGDSTAGNIAAILDWGADQHGAFLVMPYYRSGTLHDYVAKHGLLGEQDLFQVARGLAHALRFVHGKGILHRDVKPQNILLAENQDPHLTDFGIARDHLSTITESGHGIGSPYYGSPEQMAGEQVDERTDIYGFGATIYFAAAGKHPTQVDELLLPLKMRPIVMRCLNAKPQMRFATAEELLEALRKSRDSLAATITPSNADDLDQCLSCGGLNHKTAQHCTSCGHTLFVRCPICSHSNRGMLRFCAECGMSVESWQFANERVEHAGKLILTGRFDEAGRFLDEASQLFSPQLPTAIAMRKRLQRRRDLTEAHRRAGRKALALDRFDDAMAAFQALAKIAPEDQEAADELQALRQLLREQRLSDLASEFRTACDLPDFGLAEQLHEELLGLGRKSLRTRDRDRWRKQLDDCRVSNLDVLRQELPAMLPKTSDDGFADLVDDLKWLGMSQIELARWTSARRAFKHREARHTILGIGFVAVATVVVFIVLFLPGWKRQQAMQDLVQGLDGGDVSAVQKLLSDNVLEDQVRGDAEQAIGLLQLDVASASAEQMRDAWQHAATLLNYSSVAHGRFLARVNARLNESLAEFMVSDEIILRGSADKPVQLPYWLAYLSVRMGDRIVKLENNGVLRWDGTDCKSRCTMKVGEMPSLIQVAVVLEVDTTPPLIESESRDEGVVVTINDDQGVADVSVSDQYGDLESGTLDPLQPALASERRLPVHVVVIPRGIAVRSVQVTAIDGFGNKATQTIDVPSLVLPNYTFTSEPEVRYSGDSYFVEGRIEPQPKRGHLRLRVGADVVGQPVAIDASGSFSDRLPDGAKDAALLVGEQSLWAREFETGAIMLVVQAGASASADVTAAPALDSAVSVRCWQDSVKISAHIANRSKPCQLELLDGESRKVSPDRFRVVQRGDVFEVEIDLLDQFSYWMLRVTDELGRTGLKRIKVERDASLPELGGHIIVHHGDREAKVPVHGGPDFRLLAVRPNTEGAQMRDGFLCLPLGSEFAVWGQICVYEIDFETVFGKPGSKRVEVDVRAPRQSETELSNSDYSPYLPEAATQIDGVGRTLVVSRGKWWLHETGASGPVRTICAQEHPFQRVLDNSAIGKRTACPEVVTVSHQSGRVALLRCSADGIHVLVSCHPCCGVGIPPADGLIGAVPIDERRLVAVSSQGWLSYVTCDDPAGCQRMLLPSGKDELRNKAASRAFHVVAGTSHVYVGQVGGYSRAPIASDGLGSIEFVVVPEWNLDRAIRVVPNDDSDLAWAVTEGSAKIKIWQCRAGRWLCVAQGLSGKLVNVQILPGSTGLLLATDKEILIVESAANGAVAHRMSVALGDAASKSVIDVIPVAAYCVDKRLHVVGSKREWRTWDLP